MGLNEFVGYLAVALVALLTGYLVSAYGLRPYRVLYWNRLVSIGFISKYLSDKGYQEASADAFVLKLP